MIKILITLLLLPVFGIAQKDTIYIDSSSNLILQMIDTLWQCDRDTTQIEFYNYFDNYMPTFYDDFEYYEDEDLNGEEKQGGFFGILKYVRTWLHKYVTDANIFQYLIQQGYAVPLFFGVNHWANNKTAIELEIAIDAATLKTVIT